MRTNATYHFTELDDAKHLPNLHNGYIVVPADKTQNNNMFLCKKSCIECFIKEHNIDNSIRNLSNTTAKEDILGHHQSMFMLFGYF